MLLVTYIRIGQIEHSEGSVPVEKVMVIPHGVPSFLSIFFNTVKFKRAQHHVIVFGGVCPHLKGVLNMADLLTKQI